MMRNGNVFKKFILTGLVSTVLALTLGSNLAFASSYSSGPSGTQVNGWYKDSSSIVFMWHHVIQPGDNYVGVCGANPGAQIGDTEAIVYNFLGGKHSYNFLTNSHGDIYVSVDSQSSQQVVGVCNNGGSGFFYPYPPDSGSVLWQGSVGVDNKSPSISITSPSNNSNVYANSVVVSGTASDADSGVSKVTVNGQQANLSGSTFSVSLSLVQGLNTISAVATDLVGHTANSNSIIVDASYSGSSASPSTGSSGSGSTSSSSKKPTQSNGSTSGNSSTPNNQSTLGAQSSSSQEAKNGQSLNQVHDSSLLHKPMVYAGVPTLVAAGGLTALGLKLGFFKKGIKYLPFFKSLVKLK